MDLNREQTILVVDDEADLCDILRYNLQMAGYMVRTANSAEEALERGLDGIDLILLDVMMGEISGFRMASMLKKEKDTAHIPIIFITAKDTENDTVTGAIRSPAIVQRREGPSVGRRYFLLCIFCCEEGESL